jgi:hypothetical protein
MNDQRPIEFRKVPAASGWGWLAQSLRMLRAQAPRLLFIAVVMQIILGLAQVPLLSVLVVIAVPGLTAGILEAFHVTGGGGSPSLGLLFRPLSSRDHRGRLLALGALVFAIGLLCVSLLLPAGGLELDEELLVRIQQGDAQAVAALDPGLIRRLLMALMVSVAISGTITYLSIPLVWFGRARLWPAIGAGLRALIVNWMPFLLLGAGLLAVFLPLALISGLLIQLTAAGGLVAMFAMGLLMVLLLLFQLILFGTQYCAYRELFGLETGAEATEEPANGDGQLVA